MDYYTLPFIFGEDEFQAIADLLFPLGVAIGTPNQWGSLKKDPPLEERPPPLVFPYF